jgi:hypothetical protein
MGADLSRVRFDAHRDHAGVVLQQGRLLLDADFNELVDVLDRRIRAGIADLDSPGPAAGIAGVAVVPRTTPQGFAITLSGGALHIGRGRMYVDGLLAEHHGSGPAQFDPILAEQHGQDPIAYTAQPYWPSPDPLPTTGTHLAYLDVWQREVTHVEAPDLVDPAIAVDTTARTQIAWQVRLHPLPATGVGCATADAAIPGWAAVIAPSGARLTVGTVPVADTDDPCALPPAGGYRGLENQTYRVQVHTGGQPGTATFTWSRDNASVVEPVVEVLPGATALRPASLGKDAVLGFADRDWVEILDDARELSGRPGEMRRIEVDEAAGTLTFAPALPADLVMTPAQAAARHLRVRRWDQRGRVTSGTGALLADLDAPGASGVITVPASAATSVLLEHGIVVRFSTTGAAFRSGDHWEFVARAADASVEELHEAPPRGVHHHYARLAVVDFPGTVRDCRTLWPPPAGTGERTGCSDCTVCVTPASHASGALTISAAVRRVVEAGGGTVCLAAGAYHLDEAGVVVEDAASVRIRGQGLRTVLLAAGEGVVVRRSTYVTVRDLTVVSSGARPGVTLEGTVRARVESVTVLSLGRRDLPAPAVLLSGVALFPAVIDCVLVAGTGIAAGETLLTGGLDVARNVLLCATAGLDLSGQVVHLLGNRVAANTVLRCTEVGIRLLGNVAPGHGCTVTGNVLLADGGGIEVSSTGCTVTGNEVTGTARSLESRGHGIAVLRPSSGSLRGPTTITGNQVQDVGGAAVLVAAPVSALVGSGNLIERTLSGIVLVQRARAETVTITDNVVRDVASRPSDDAGRAVGIAVVGALRATVAANVVDGVGTARETIGEAVGIDLLACAQSRVAGNAVDRIGFAEAGGRDLGIGVRGLLLRAAVSGNTVRRQPVDVDEDAPSGFQGLLVGADADPREPRVVGVGGYAVGTGDATFVVGPHAAYAVAFRPATVTLDTNIVSGSGELATALVGVAGEVVASANQLHARMQGGAAALHVRASAASVSTNRLRGGEPSGVLDVDPKRVAVLGNLATNGITVAGGALPSPWDQFNPTGF